MARHARKIEIRPFRPGDDDTLLERGLRPDDMAECLKITGISGDQALRDSIAHSDMVGSYIIDGKVAGIFGVARREDGCGVPWLLAHADIEGRDTAVPVLRASRAFVDHWRRVYGRLENIVDPEHSTAPGYLYKLGFFLDWGHPLVNRSGQKLIRFWR